MAFLRKPSRRSKRPQPDEPNQADSSPYQALQSQNEFRLLKLHAGQESRITCSLHHFTLDSVPSYKAISYTCSKDVALYKIHLPGSVIKVQENLRNILRSLRDENSDTWLWIDIFCINQSSNEERNHQVRLIADIYGAANVVLVWLQNAAETADVASGLRFLHAAVTHDGSEQSVYNYLKSHAGHKEVNWRSLRNLFRLRYWTRKWIIQETVVPRIVLLRAGNAECSMADLEEFCRQLLGKKDSDECRELVPPKHDIWSLMETSPAARLALHRLEERAQRGPTLLYELMERYAANECDMPCDHVYALYGLLGEHREHLSIDYAASTMQRLVSVVHFVHAHENLKPSKVSGFVNLLMRSFRLQHEDLWQERGLSEKLNLVATAHLVGRIGPQHVPEPLRFTLLRKVQPLDVIPAYWFDTSGDTWGFTVAHPLNNHLVQAYVRCSVIAGSEIHALATHHSPFGLDVWYFPGTQLAFLIQRSHQNRAVLVGRAYLFSVTRDSVGIRRERRLILDDNVQQETRQISLNLASLLELSFLARWPKKTLERQLQTIWPNSAFRTQSGGDFARGW